MQRISSRSTKITKWVFPIFWFGFLLIFFVAALFGRPRGPETFAILFIPCVMLVVGFLVMKALIFDLVDEVWDAGDYLVVKNKGEETSIRLEEIVNLNYSTFTNPKRATLRLRNPGRFGKEVAFLPKANVTVWRFTRNENLEQLIDRIDAARRKRGG